MIVSRETDRELLSHPGVSRETNSRLLTFLDLVQRWNRQINLVASSDLHQLQLRHVADSLALLPYMPPRLQRAIDLGSGAGFPGLVLAIASGVHFDLIEADRRKAAFLAEAARATRAPVRVFASRIEVACCDPAMLITSRALAPLDRLLALAIPLLEPDGVCIFPKGRNFQSEIDYAKKNWTMTITCERNLASLDGVILKIGQISRG